MLDREDGFTMVELMVIVLIIGLLVAVALPTMIGARQRANDAHAKGTAARALRAGKIVYVDDQTYVNATPAALTAADPGMTYVAGATASSDPETVSSAAPSQHEFVVAAYSATGSCFFLMDDAVGGGLSYGRLSGLLREQRGRGDVRRELVGAQFQVASSISWSESR